jgi:hypothetical protein
MGQNIARVTWPASASEFELLVREQIPVLFREVASDWPCTRLWTLPYLRERLTEKLVTVTSSAAALYRPDEARGHYAAEQMLQMTFADFLDRISGSGPDLDGKHYYLHKQSLDQHLPELKPDVPIPAYIEASPFLMTSLWMGPAGSITPIHHDFTNNLFLQVRGRKRLILYPPDPEHAFYRLPFRSLGGRSSWHISRVGSLTTFDRGAFPRFKDAEPIDLVVEPGTMLLIPNFYWHEVHSLDTPSISLSYWWDARSFQEIETSINSITTMLQSYDSAPPEWKSMMRRLVSAHMFTRN